MSLPRYHRKILYQMLVIIPLLLLLHFLAKILPPPFSVIMLILISLGWILFLGLTLTFFSLQVVLNFRFERSFIPQNLKIPAPRHLKQYQILNPLAVPGEFRKAQLHTHSSLSYDGKTPPAEVVKTYRRDGYSFLCVTDHDRINRCQNLSTPDLLVLPGTETTIPFLFWPIPLGKHLVVINPPLNISHRRLERLRFEDPDGMAIIPAHLSWRGGAGTGRWYPDELLSLKNLKIIEIDSPHSKDPVDLTIWHKINVNRGPKNPVWGVAVDDSHNGSSNRGWIMVKTGRIHPDDFISALKSGAFYATNGPALDIAVRERDIFVKSGGVKWIRFFNSQNQVIAVFRSSEAVYRTRGDEGFVRAEAADERGRTAWSQPMWLVPQD